jgi:hypothetical protein
MKMEGAGYPTPMVLSIKYAASHAKKAAISKIKQNIQLFWYVALLCFR